MGLDQFLDEMWKDYCQFNPRAKKIYTLLSEKNKVINDHIALRTYSHSLLGIQHLAEPFEKLGYKACGEYHFEEKKLKAKHYEHQTDSTQPKIFISELLLKEFDSSVQKAIEQLVESVDSAIYKNSRSPYMGRPWEIDYATYELLAKSSEYASWVAAHGFRPNHFTVFVNALEQFEGLEDLNNFIESRGYELNDSGGKIKGTPEVFLEQSSTMAETVKVSFRDGTYEIPSCYYEFAKRFPKDDGSLYQGFVTQSADKIFESTHQS